MKRTRAALAGLAVASALAVGDVAAQATALPTAFGISLGIGPTFPKALEPPCPDGRPLVAGVQLSWRTHRLSRLEVTASRFGNGAKASCGDTLPCPRDRSCPTETGIGQALMPVGVRLLLEPMGREARWSPRLVVGAGRLVGDGESYATLGAGVGYLVRRRLNVVFELERLLFRAPVDVRDLWTGELLSGSRDGVAVNLIRFGIGWGT